MEDTSMISAFDEERAAKLGGVSRQQLSYWCRTGFFRPAYSASGGRAFSRIYSFRDIVALRVLNALRNQFAVSLQHLREVSDKLAYLDEDKWTGVRLYVVKKRVAWIDPDSEIPQEILSGQYIVPVVLDDVVDHTKKDIVDISARDAQTVGKIHRSKYIARNAPVISGTRVRVSAIMAFSEAGYSVAQILEEYPGLDERDVHAALDYGQEKSAA